MMEAIYIFQGNHLVKNAVSRITLIYLLISMIFMTQITLRFPVNINLQITMSGRLTMLGILR